MGRPDEWHSTRGPVGATITGVKDDVEFILRSPRANQNVAFEEVAPRPRDLSNRALSDAGLRFRVEASKVCLEERRAGCQCVLARAVATPCYIFAEISPRAQVVWRSTNGAG